MVFSSMAAMVPLGFGVGALQGGTFSAHLHWVFGSTAIVCAPCTVAAYWAVPTLPPSSGLAAWNAFRDRLCDCRRGNVRTSSRCSLVRGGDATRSVIVLEAGKNLVEDPRVQTPALWTTLMGPEADWQFQTTQVCLSKPATILGDRVIKEPQGKMLGGSSGINGQAFVAPTKAGIDGWAKLGATNWT
ncbi:hypothetical protein F9C07_705 [Aspergillus flavus]|uniref:Glucose-methanol-choline oxidoreductase N-terminal domain-containing protein n=1 Tax=Aspergillus flavus (strain ATCC 200026 / FGSC A1120 / IAM 13836 / NRRL 3357 / JCM 12722 / SRRC 167) TaxID=332952 RepID=A0A7U2MQ00_ASPFN|nr:hypothetical protein F9C07_705 [Aspergillus flavus]